jgi:endo-1,4-beta-xylanase
MQSRRWTGVYLFVAAVVPALWSAIPAAVAVVPSLREAAGEHLLIGGAVSSRDLEHPQLSALVLREFSCLTADNELMPALVVDDRGRYTFGRADRVADFARDHHLPFFGHMLLWHHITRRWLFQTRAGEPLPREQALANLERYIRTVAGHFRGRVQAWDVVNEALSDQPGEYLRPTPALRAIGEDYIAKAFVFAHAADPDAELYYNDYNIELPDKRAKTLRLLRSLRAQGVPIHAVGIQGHWHLDFPEAHVITDAIREFRAAGFKVMITELDVDVLPRTTSGADLQSVEEGPNPYAHGLPDNIQRRLAERYREIFNAILREPGVTMITFWGTWDGGSWLNDFPVKRRTNYPLLFDRNFQPKPAYAAVIEALEQAQAKRSR